MRRIAFEVPKEDPAIERNIQRQPSLPGRREVAVGSFLFTD